MQAQCLFASLSNILKHIASIITANSEVMVFKAYKAKRTFYA